MDFSQVIVQGTATGLIYALIGVGFVLVFRTVGLFNFAHTESYTIGAFAAFVIVTRLGLPYWQGLVIAGLISGLVGIVTERIAFRRLLIENAPSVNVIVASIAVATILRGLVLLIWGPDAQPIQGVTQIFEIGPVTVQFQNLLILATVVLMFLGMGYLLHRTRFGIALRAVADNRRIASAMGVDFRITLPLTFGLAGLLGGVAGALVAPIVFPQFQMGQAVLVKAFAASVIGGLDSIPGAIVGGLLIGLIESLVGAYVTSTYSDLVAFVLLIVVLIARPTGVLGGQRLEKV